MAAVVLLVLLAANMFRRNTFEASGKLMFNDDVIEVDVYVVALSGVGVSGLGNVSRALEGVEAAVEAVNVNNYSVMVWPRNGYGYYLNVSRFIYYDYGDFGFSDWLRTEFPVDATLHVVSDWVAYWELVEGGRECVIINAHGETLPIPVGYSKESWTDRIAEAMLCRNVTWVHLGGYPFYYAWSEGSNSTESWGEAGFQRLMQHIGKGDMTISHFTDPFEKAGATTATEQYLKDTWPAIYEANSVSMEYPMLRTDVEDYVALPIWVWNEYYEGVVIAFVKPNERFDPQTRSGFGAYVHIGTGQTFNSAVNPTDTDIYCGYVGCAAAVWTATTGFEGVMRSSSYSLGDVNFTISVTSAIAEVNWWSTSHTWEIHIGFFIYGGLKRPPYSDIDIDKIGLYVEPIPQDENFSIEPYNEICFNAYPDFSQQLMEFNAEMSSKILKTLLWGISWLDPTQTSKVLSSAWLMSDWLSLITFNDFSQPDKDVNVEFWANTYSSTEGRYTMVEFQSIFGVSLSLPNTAREGWRIIPIHWGAILFPTGVASNYGPKTGDNTALAVYFPRENADEYTATVLFDDFEEETALYLSGDLNSSSGQDYWDTMDYNYRFQGSPVFPGGKCFWCAAVGYNSIYYNQPNIDILYYDKYVDAYLQRDINLRPYKRAWLYYRITVDIEPGDHLTVYAKPFGDDWNWVPIDSITSTDEPIYNEWQQPDEALPNTVSSIRFMLHSSNDNQVSLGAIIYYMEIRAELPNDAYTNSDAGDKIDEPTSITANLFSGYLNDEDWYQRNISDTTNRRFTVNPPENAIFYLELYDQANTKIAGPSEVIEIQFQMGITLKIRIYSVIGFGQYIFKIEAFPPPGGGGGGGGTCPTLFVWNGTDYVEEGILDIHAESDITLQHQIQQPLVRSMWLYKLSLRELDNFTSHIDQVRLYAVDENEEWHLCPLVSAYHSELGYITWKLRFDDDNRADLAPSQNSDLHFMPSIPHSSTAYFIFEITGYNRKAHT